MKLAWSRIVNCDSAQDFSKVLYIWARSGHVRYIGKAKSFGGPRGRYAFGYQYLARLLLESGFRLYVSSLSPRQWKQVENIERTLIAKLETPKLENRRRPEPKKKVTLTFDQPWKNR
jgi:hypothetical protein